MFQQHRIFYLNHIFFQKVEDLKTPGALTGGYMFVKLDLCNTLRTRTPKC